MQAYCGKPEHPLARWWLIKLAAHDKAAPWSGGPGIHDLQSVAFKLLHVPLRKWANGSVDYKIKDGVYKWVCVSLLRPHPAALGPGSLEELVLMVFTRYNHQWLRDTVKSTFTSIKTTDFSVSKVPLAWQDVEVGPLGAFRFWGVLVSWVTVAGMLLHC